MTASPKITPELVREHGLSDSEYAHVLKLMGREPSFVELGIFSVMWSEHCSYKSTRAHLKKLPTKAPWVIQGPGRECRGDRHRRWRCLHIQDGIPQPSQLHRTVPGRGDRRGRHHARRLHHGGAAHRDDERPALWRAVASQDPASGQRCGQRHRRLWQLHGRADGGRRSQFPQKLQRQHPGQRHVRRAGAAGQNLSVRRQGRGQSGGLYRVENRPRRHPRRHHG